MSYVPNTSDELQEMIDEIGVRNFDELLMSIPQSVRVAKNFDLFPSLSETEVITLLNGYSKRNVNVNDYICFIGGGAYDHWIPALVPMIIDRSEFKTAYTPYQAEVSQGTLQAMYEFQSMICDLTGMDVANASMLDGGSALAEAILMSNAINQKKGFVFAGTINPNYVKIAKTLTGGKAFNFEFAYLPDGTCDLEKLEQLVDERVSAVIVQQPNFFGNIEDVFEIEKIVHNKKAFLISIVDPITLGVLTSPGEYRADIVVGEGQTLGIPLSFGGPYLGLFATKQEFIRKIPGRLSGLTLDKDGKRAFVLTLQTREQQIKRERATSNICTNQGLMMLAATVYLSILGKNGIKQVGEICFRKAHFLANEIIKIPKFQIESRKPFFREFLVSTPVEPSKIIESGKREKLLPGLDISKFFKDRKGLLIAVTEKRSDDELNRLVEFLRKFS
ncbi:MAG: aminomethyl-transferring glycine dehydrogenase subunit GcvPA [Candidatus Kapaibacteriales bacterium]